MGSKGKHVAKDRSSAESSMPKHAAQDVGRPRLKRLVVVAGALAVVAVGCLLLLGQAASRPSPARANEAVTVASDSAPARSTVPGIRRLVVYGHSMPEGGGASDPSLGYPVVAAEMLGLQLVNRAEGGTGAANATKTMEAAPPAGPHDAVVLHTGMNDIFRRGGKAVGRGRQAIRHFLAGTAGAGRRVVILECQPGSWKYTPPGRNLQHAYESWNTMLRQEAARASDVDVLDTCASWDPQRFTNVRRYHPNDVGHARMAADLAGLLSRS